MYTAIQQTVMTVVAVDELTCATPAVNCVELPVEVVPTYAVVFMGMTEMNVGVLGNAMG